MDNLTEEGQENVLTVGPYQFEPLKASNFIESDSSSEESESDNGEFIADENTERKGNTNWWSPGLKSGLCMCENLGKALFFSTALAPV